MYLLYFLVSLLASTIGGICGVGGGVIIKPVLDATGTMNVSSISFLSGCTVLSMSIISVLRNSQNKEIIDVKTSTPLSVGAVIGGIVGKLAFDLLREIFQNENHLGAVQAGLLTFITLVTLLCSIYSKKIHTIHVESTIGCCFIGFAMGILSSFLGIGGGPINLTILFFFFSMDTKKAAANSLYIIMFSQFSSFLQTVIGGTIPTVSVLILALMVIAGALGGIIGSYINKKISVDVVNHLFIGLMVLIVGINIYNVINFSVC